MERMAEAVPNTSDQAYQHFLSVSPWEEEAVIDQHCHDTNQLIGGKKDSCLLIDETAFPKKGRDSVGVAHQYCGQKGKIDNCQVGVFAVLAHRHHVAPLDGRLFLPKSWTDDKERCRSVGVPEEFIEYQRKQDLALQIVIAARLRGVEFNWIGFDAFYGSDPGFLRFLNDMGEIFVGDIRGNQRIYLEDPKPFIPDQKSKKGRCPTRLKTNRKPIRVDSWTEQQDDDAWVKLNVRDSSKGKLKNSKDFPLLSSNNIVELLTHYLPNRKATEEEIFEQLLTRHLKRQWAIDSAYRKQFFKDRLNPY